MDVPCKILMFHKAFTDPEVLAVQLNVFPENARAKRCYEGVGFTERHNTPDAFKYKDESLSAPFVSESGEEIGEEDPHFYKALDMRNNNGKANDEIGIISEIFFYANYMHDLCVTKRFTMVEPQRGLGDDERGYQDIFDSVARNGINRINAIMLAPKYSEFIVDETVRILNNNCMDGLGYYKAIYDPEDIGVCESFSVKEIS